MDKKQVNRSCVTNADEKDPIINKFMRDYADKIGDCQKSLDNENLIVNFDITYPDGRCENYTCSGVSNVFGKENSSNNNQCEKDNCQKLSKKSKPQIVQNNDQFDERYNKYKEFTSLARNYSEYFKEYEKYVLEQIKNEEIDELKDKECGNENLNKIEKINGKITVYCSLGDIGGIDLKGVLFNLYRIDGLSPCLVDCKKTDSSGKVCFLNIPEGNYRVIEVINKKYFSKPTYIKWNEVNIDSENGEYTIYVVNKMR